MDLNTRLVKLMQFYDYSPSLFADEVGIIRSSISHIVSGRNKPGVDLLQKVLKRFPEISTDWLLLGVGAMFKDVNNSRGLNVAGDLQTETISNSKEFSLQTEKLKPATASIQMNLLDYVGDPDPRYIEPENMPEKEMTEQDESADAMLNEKPAKLISAKKIKRITVYYTDGTFGDFIEQ